MIRARCLYKQYGGKIFAIGRISDKPAYDYREGDNIYHWGSRFYAKIDKIYVLEAPIDISEFSKFIVISRRSAITPVIGNDFERLKKIIMNQNKVPKYFKEGRAIPLPLQKISQENWLEITQLYRRRFTLEIQFRRFYVDYLLRIIGDQKTFYSECACYKNSACVGYADNAILLRGRWIFVEVKLNVCAESDIFAQLKKYSEVENAVAREGRTLPSKKIEKKKMIVIDTASIYFYRDGEKQLEKVVDLDEINTQEDVKFVREKLITLM